MRILFVCQWFPPEPAIVPQSIVDALVDEGHEVTVLTGQPNYPSGSLSPGYTAWKIQTERHDGYRIVRTPLYPSHDRSATGRALNYLSWATTSAVATLLLRRRDVTLLYSSPATASLGPWLARRLLGRRYVAMVQDLWPDSVTSSGMLQTAGPMGRFAVGILSCLSTATYRAAERVVVISPGAREVLAERGVKVDRIDLVYNWAAGIDPTGIYEPDRSIIAAGDEDFVITYAGNVGPAQQLDIVLDAADLLDPGISFRIVGDGVDLARLRARAASMELDNIVFMDRVAGELMPVIYASSDINLVALGPDPLFAATMPSKVQAILASGTPVISIAHGDAGQIATRSGAGWRVAPGDVDGLVTVIRSARAMSAAELADLGAAGRAFYEQHMSRPVGVTRLTTSLCAAARTSEPLAPDKPGALSR